MLLSGKTPCQHCPAKSKRSNSNETKVRYAQGGLVLIINGKKLIEIQPSIKYTKSPKYCLSSTRPLKHKKQKIQSTYLPFNIVKEEILAIHVS